MSFLKKFLPIFLVELGSFAILFGLVDFLGRLFVALGSLKISLFLFWLFFVALIVWTVSRAIIWQGIVKKGNVIKGIGFGIPFILINWSIISCLLFILGLILRMLGKGYILSYLVIALIFSPLIFYISNYTSIAFYKFFKTGKNKAFLPQVEGLNKNIYIVSTVFVVLTIISQGLMLLPKYIFIPIMAISLSTFLAWSKLYLLKI